MAIVTKIDKNVRPLRGDSLVDQINTNLDAIDLALTNLQQSLSAIPAKVTKTSELTNDSDFVTKAELPVVPTKLTQLTNDAGFITNAAIPSVPTKLTQLMNDAGFITASAVTSAINAISNVGLQNITATAYSPVAADAAQQGQPGNLLVMNSTAAQTIVIQPFTTTPFAVGAQLNVVQIGAGKVTFVAGTGVTLISVGSLKSIAAQAAAVTLIQLSKDTWIILGALTA